MVNKCSYRLIHLVLLTRVVLMKLKDFADTQFYITVYRCKFYVIEHGYLTINNYEDLKNYEILYWYIDEIKDDVITIKLCLV